MPESGFDVEGARKSGYSDDDIIGHLTKTRGFDVEGAVKSGYSKADIITHLSSSPPVNATPKRSPSLWERGKKAFSDFNPAEMSPFRAQAGKGIGTVLEDTAKGIASIPGQSWGKVQEAGDLLKRGEVNNAAGALIEAVPVLGPNARAFLDDVWNGKVPEAVGHAGTLAINALMLRNPKANAADIDAALAKAKTGAQKTATAAKSVAPDAYQLGKAGTVTKSAVAGGLEKGSLIKPQSFVVEAVKSGRKAAAEYPNRFQKGVIDATKKREAETAANMEASLKRAKGQPKPVAPQATGVSKRQGPSKPVEPPKVKTEPFSQEQLDADMKRVYGEDKPVAPRRPVYADTPTPKPDEPQPFTPDVEGAAALQKSKLEARNSSKPPAREPAWKGAPATKAEAPTSAAPDIEGATAAMKAKLEARAKENAARPKLEPGAAVAVPDDPAALDKLAKGIGFKGKFADLDAKSQDLVRRVHRESGAQSNAKSGPVKPPAVAAEKPAPTPAPAQTGPVEPPQPAKSTSDISPSNEAAKQEAPAAAPESGPIKPPSAKVAANNATRQERLNPVLEKTPVGPDAPFDVPEDVVGDLRSVLGRTGSKNNQAYGAYRKQIIIPKFLDRTGRWNEFISAAEEVAKSNKLDTPEGIAQHKSNLEKLNQEYNLAHDYFTKANEHITDAAKKWDLPQSGFTSNSTRHLTDKVHGTMRDVLQRAPKEFRSRVEAIENMLGERPDQ